MDFTSQKLGRRVALAKLLKIVQIAVFEFAKDGLQQI